MGHSRLIEIIVGLFIAGGLAAVFVLAMQISNFTLSSVKDGYTIRARFDNVGGLKVRSPVSVSGVRVGRVTAIDYDNDAFEAVVSMVVNANYDKFPKDTSASIFTAGLLGEQYIGLEPGADQEYLAEGDELTFTQSALVLEQIIGQFLYSKAAEGAN